MRDGIRYDPYASSREPESFRASTVAASTANWCVPKSVLLAAAARNQGSRPGSASPMSATT